MMGESTVNGSLLVECPPVRVVKDSKPRSEAQIEFQTLDPVVRLWTIIVVCQWHLSHGQAVSMMAKASRTLNTTDRESFDLSLS